MFRIAGQYVLLHFKVKEFMLCYKHVFEQLISIISLNYCLSGHVVDIEFFTEAID